MAGGKGISDALWVNLGTDVTIQEPSILRRLVALLFSPVMVNAGAVYDVAIRPVDRSNIALATPDAPATAPVVTRYFVEGGKVRVGGATAKTVYIFKDRTMYVIDNTARLVHVLKHATLSQLASHYADAVRQLEDAAAGATPGNRAEADRKAADMKEASDRMRKPVPRDYRVTVRFDSVDGHACRIWEERENGAKRLEVCVAPVAAVPGGAEILKGMKTLSEFRQGSNFAFGVEFGLSEWWSDIDMLGGVPILIREYKYDSEISEVMLSVLGQGMKGTTQFDIPGDYQLQAGPDYTQWYLR